MAVVIIVVCSSELVVPFRREGISFQYFVFLLVRSFAIFRTVTIATMMLLTCWSSSGCYFAFFEVRESRFGVIQYVHAEVACCRIRVVLFVLVAPC